MPPKSKIKKRKGVISSDAIIVTIPVSDKILETFLSTKLCLPKEHLSPSSIGTFLRCPYQFMKQYLEGKRGADSVEAMEGTTHHSTFEYNNRRKVKTGKDRLEKQLHEFFCDNLHDNWKKIENKDGYRERDLVIRGRKIQSRYLKVFAPRFFPDLVEQEFVVKIGPVKILCYMDVSGELKVIGSKEKKRIVCDYKVSGKRKYDKEISHSIQLTTYGVCDMAARHTDVMPDVGFCTCVKSNNPSIEWQPATLHQGRIDWLVRTTLSVADAISRGSFPVCDPTENGLCSEKWCPCWNECLGSCVPKKLGKGRK